MTMYFGKLAGVVASLKTMTARCARRLVATTDEDAEATIAFDRTYPVPPLVSSVDYWIDGTKIMAEVVNVTTTSVSVRSRRSRSSLLLTSGPYELAPNTIISIRV